MLMVEADRDKKCGDTDDESYASECQIVEDFVRDELIGRLDIPYPDDIEQRLEHCRDPKYRSMNSIDQDEKKYIYEREKCHTRKYRENRSKIKKN